MKVSRAFFMLLCLLILAGCRDGEEVRESERATPEEVWLSKINDLESRIKTLEEERTAWKDQVADYKKMEHEYHQLNQDFKRLREDIQSITEAGKVHYERVADEVREQPDTVVVYVENVPKEYRQQRTILLKLAVQFSHMEDRIITLWESKADAVTFAKGDYDDEGKVLGWSGMDSRFGMINNKNNTLLYFFSRDDIEPIEFGKYTTEPFLPE